MKISIVVPAFNEEKLVVESLRSIKAAAEAFTEHGWQSEIIVCDNNSTDRTADLARSEGARVIFEPINQIGRARNTGAASAVGDWLIFVDADSRPNVRLFGEVAQAIQNGQYLAGGCTVELDDRLLILALFLKFWNLISRTMKYAAGSFIFCDANAFREIGGFNLELFASEELDLSQRLKKLARQKGKRIVILHRYPLVTSARKMRLYSLREYLRFLGRTVVRLGSTLKDSKECHMWYDGRR